MNLFTFLLASAAVTSVISGRTTTYEYYDFKGSQFCHSYGYKGNSYPYKTLAEATAACDSDKDCAAVTQWFCGTTGADPRLHGGGSFGLCGTRNYQLGYYGWERCTFEKKSDVQLKRHTYYQKLDNQFCHSYGYKGNAYPYRTQKDAENACDSDIYCAGVVQWFCGSTGADSRFNGGGSFGLCGTQGYGLGNYGHGRCTYQKNYKCEITESLTFTESSDAGLTSLAGYLHRRMADGSDCPRFLEEGETCNWTPKTSAIGQTNWRKDQYLQCNVAVGSRVSIYPSHPIFARACRDGLTISVDCYMTSGWATTSTTYLHGRRAEKDGEAHGSAATIAVEAPVERAVPEAERATQKPEKKRKKVPRSELRQARPNRHNYKEGGLRKATLAETASPEEIAKANPLI